MYKQQLEKNILYYYKAEFKEAIFMLMWGGIFTFLSILILLRTEEVFWLGVGYSIFPLSGIQLLTAIRNLLLLKSKKQKLLYSIKEDFNPSIQKEKLRILNIQIRLRFYRLIEQILFFMGLLFTIVGGVFGWSVFLAGSGIGLMLQSAILLVQDLFAEWRAGLYLGELETADRS